MEKRHYYLIGIIVLILGFITYGIVKYSGDNHEGPDIPYQENKGFNDFDFKIIKDVNKNYKENFLVSPLSIAYALSMANDGANNETKEQISNLLGNYNLTKINNIKDTIGIANGVFIKNAYQGIINNEFINTIKDKYNGDVIYDEFTTPDAINDWISEKTYKMIKNAVDDISEDFVLAIANAIEIDVSWRNEIKCESTTSEEFTLANGETIDAAMMHTNENITYIENDNAKGIIKDYKEYNGIELEYIAILPNDDLNTYLNYFDKNELETLLSNKKESNDQTNIILSLPKYTYDFDYKKIAATLYDYGMTDAFDEGIADFSNITPDLNIYISKVIHKSHIELSEKGTKAAAVTVITLYKNALPMYDETIEIKFNKPFIYLIKEKNNDNIWFYGAVYEPMKYEDHKCETNQ